MARRMLVLFRPVAAAAASEAIRHGVAYHRVDSYAPWCAAMVADSLIPPSRLAYGSGTSTSCQRVRHAAYPSERAPSEPRRSNSFTRCCRLRHRVDDQLDRLDVCCRIAIGEQVREAG